MFEPLLYAVLLPLLISGGIISIAWKPWRFRRASADARVEETGTSEENESSRRLHPVFTRGASAIGLALAYCVCHLGLHGMPVGGQPEAWEWLLMVVPLAAVVGVVSCWPSLPNTVRLALFLALAVVAAWCIVPTFQSSPWVWRATIAVAVFGLAYSQSEFLKRLPGIVTPLSWVIVGSFGLPVLIASANAKFGFFATSVAAASGAIILLWLWNRDRLIGLGATPVVAVLLPTLFFSGYFNDYGDVPPNAFLMLVTAPLVLWTSVFMMGAATPRPWLSSIVGLSLLLIPCCFALYRVWPILTAEPAY